MHNGAAPSSTVPAINLDPPDDGEAEVCSWCCRVIDGETARALTNTVIACSPACEAELSAMWCSGCGANVAEGDDHSAGCEHDGASVFDDEPEFDEDDEPDWEAYEWDAIGAAS